MKLRVLYPAERTIATDDREQFIEQSRQLYGRTEGVRSNLVITASGAHTDASGTSEGISNDVDRAILTALRRNTEIVLTGGATARAESYKKPKTARLAILTASGDLEGIPAVASQDGPRVIALASAKAAEKLRSSPLAANLNILTLPETQDDPTGQIAGLTALRAAGFSSILNESGPKGIRALSEAGLLQEICLTITKLPGTSFSFSDVGLQKLGVEAKLYEMSLLAAAENSLFMVWRKKA